MFRPLWKQSDPGIRLAAVREIEDQGLLAEIARNDRHWRVRQEAVKKLTDRDILAAIAAQDRDLYVRLEATCNTGDLSLLAKRVEEETARGSKQVLVRRRRRTGVFDWLRRRHKVLFVDENGNSLLVAVVDIRDEEVLASIALNGRIMLGTRCVAVDCLVDQGLLGRIALEADHYVVRNRALQRVVDRGILIKASQEDENERIRLVAGFLLRRLPRMMDDRDGMDRRQGDQNSSDTSKIARKRGVMRNAPCPCGSGKKYKKCCGAEPDVEDDRTGVDPNREGHHEDLADGQVTPPEQTEPS